MGKLNESTLKMMEGYEALWRKGYSAPQIAEHFNLAPGTVYKYLEEIAKKIGVAREDLLVAPHSEHQSYNRKKEMVKPISIDEVKQSFADTLAKMDEATEGLDVLLGVLCEEEE